jgi:rRNA maturation endonuclease Nob1
VKNIILKLGRIKMNKETTQTTLKAEKRIFQRRCKRCQKLFYSYARNSKFCPKCYFGNHYSKNFGKLNEDALNKQNKALCREVTP